MIWRAFCLCLITGSATGASIANLSEACAAAVFDKGQVTFHLPSRDLTVQVEVARDGVARRQGLMQRKSLAPHHGMLFVFEKEKHQSFWMKNTYISLDMIFVNAKLEVIGVVHGAEPMTSDPRNVPGISQYVVEMEAGYAERFGIQKGVRISLINVGPPRS